MNKIRLNMKLKQLCPVILTSMLLSLVWWNPSVSASPLENSELAALVKKAYVYSFPVYEMYRMRQGAVYDHSNPIRADLNHFGHVRELSDHTARRVTTPNNDTLYTNGWLDLSQEPVILSVPDTAGRYYTIPFMDFFTNNFAFIGRRTTGTKAGDFVIVGPGWIGATPAGLPVIKAPTNSVFLLARTMVNDQADLPNVHKIQDQYKLTPLSIWTKTGKAKVTTDLNNPPLAPNPKDPWDFFKIVNLGLTENPPPADEAPLLSELAKIGVGPGQNFDPNRLTEGQRQVVLTAMQEAAKGIPMERTRFANLVHEGWMSLPPNLGKYGKDYSLRAWIALVGFAALDPEEACYFSGIADKSGKPYMGKNRYRLHFEKGTLPPVDGFWSLSMYEITPEQRLFFVDNPIHRYAIGDRTKDLKLNNDGSLDIHIQNQSPGKDLESNWLPAPSGPFRLVFRTYQPREIILKGGYKLPGVQQME
ncbi:MAG: DUF1254 domain-containing protein [Deltaproteobacteria bacterium]|nr:DUF1254 domain-containing protein [Deltaproteobacteria bacterium]